MARSVGQIREELHLARAMLNLESHKAWQQLLRELKDRADRRTKTVMVSQHTHPQDLGALQGEVRLINWLVEIAETKAGRITDLEEELRSAEKMEKIPGLVPAGVETPPWSDR